MIQLGELRFDPFGKSSDNLACIYALIDALLIYKAVRLYIIIHITMPASYTYSEHFRMVVMSSVEIEKSSLAQFPFHRLDRLDRLDRVNR